MQFRPEQPYNDLPLLPPKADIETKNVLKKLVSARAGLAELKGRAPLIPNQDILINNISLQEAKVSSEIENIITTNDELFKAISAKNYPVDKSTKEVINYRKALYSGFQAIGTNKILTINDIININETIIETTEGIRKLPGTALMNDRTNEVIYTPPAGESVIRAKLDNLALFINDDESFNVDPLIKMAMIHYQFESIHPFSDGNGRTGRIINVLYLCLKDIIDMPVLFLSRYISLHKSDYYRLLRNVTVNNDWESWIIYMLDAVTETAASTIKKVSDIRQTIDETIEMVKKQAPEIYKKELVEVLFEQPYCKSSFLEKKLGVVRQTASVYLKKLQEIHVLELQKIGKENLYLNTALVQVLKK
ncbi:MAG: Fic family protein [Bacteroidales bacterium]|nr:Fic family protein [Bacteroidales bacterium]